MAALWLAVLLMLALPRCRENNRLPAPLALDLCTQLCPPSSTLRLHHLDLFLPCWNSMALR